MAKCHQRLVRLCMIQIQRYIEFRERDSFLSRFFVHVTCELHFRCVAWHSLLVCVKFFPKLVKFILRHVLNDDILINFSVLRIYMSLMMIKTYIRTG